MINLKKIEKVYKTGKLKYHALKGIDLEIKQGDFVAIMGPSGSGKSTLLIILGCLDGPSKGEYILGGKDVARLSSGALAQVRNETFGFVFQNFNLLSYLTAYENIELPLIYSPRKYKSEEIIKALRSVNLEKWQKHKPKEMSGGQQQRVAIARALVNQPAIILADEPTGNLDSKSGTEIMNILTDLNKKGITVIMVTHEHEIADYAKRVLHIRDGKIDKDIRKPGTDSFDLAKSIYTKHHKRMFNTLNKIKQNVFIALKAIMARKMRTFLTTLGILIGVSSVIAMVSIGEGAKTNVTASIKKMGSNLLFVRPGASRRGRHRHTDAERNALTMRDAKLLQRRARYIQALTPSSSSSATMIYRGNSVSSVVNGSNELFPTINNYQIQSGKFFDKNSIQLKERVAVIGSTVKRELFGKENPLGKYIKVNKVYFQVIGILSSKGSNMWRDLDDMIVVPITTLKQRILGDKSDKVRDITVKVKYEEWIPEAIAEINKIIKESHGLGKKDEPDFHVRNMAELLERVKSTTQTFTLLLAGIASISLLVGGIGIMNIMLVSVMERIKEIGTRKAIGAKRSDILFQFLTESVIVCLLGGLIGIGLGIVISHSLKNVTQWGTHIPLYAIHISFLFSFIVGVFFGIYPSFKASALKPIEALRYE